MPSFVDSGPRGQLKEHIDSCIGCQAEASRYRSLSRIIGSFASEKYEPPFDLVPGVMGSLERPYDEAKRRVKAGVAAGAAVAVAGAVVVARLVRRRAA
jgi:hypothetical protein